MAVGVTSAVLIAAMTAHSGTALAQQQATVPLKLYYGDARADNFTTATEQGEADARAAGYRYVRVEGYVFATQQPGTVPLKLYYSDARADNFTTATAQGEADARAWGYRFVRVEGYVYPSNVTGTVPLRLWWSSARKDNFTTATDIGDHDAQAAAYAYARVEGYVLAAASTTASWAGTWRTDYGAMSLTQTGNMVRGTYAVCGGSATISGTVSGGTLTGTWNEQMCGNGSGALEFTMSGDGRSFTGKWARGSGVPTNPWNGTRSA
jgi:hypothetical protein